jgi:hypothetical protein
MGLKQAGARSQGERNPGGEEVAQDQVEHCWPQEPPQGFKQQKIDLIGTFRKDHSSQQS